MEELTMTNETYKLYLTLYVEALKAAIELRDNGAEESAEEILSDVAGFYLREITKDKPETMVAMDALAQLSYRHRMPLDSEELQTLIYLIETEKSTFRF